MKRQLLTLLIHLGLAARSRRPVCTERLEAALGLKG